MIEQDELSPEYQYAIKFRRRPEAYTIAQSILLGLIIASVAIWMGPLYGAFVAAGSTLATLLAGIAGVEEEVHPLVAVRVASRRRRPLSEHVRD